MKHESIAYVGLGSNLGEPVENLRRAVGLLRRSPDLRVISCSSIYRSEPVGYLDQPRFLNAVVEVEIGLNPEGLLGLCLAIEKTLGRERGKKWGPRIIDLDILLFNENRVARPGLTIPHPRMAERSFVLVPLLEVAPDVSLPDGVPVKRLLADLGPDETLEKIDESLEGK